MNTKLIGKIVGFVFLVVMFIIIGKYSTAKSKLGSNAKSPNRTIDASVHSWTEVKKPTRIKPLDGTKIILVTNKCFDKPIIIPSPSGETIKLGNGIWVADIAMLPGQGVREKTKVLVETIEE